MKQYDLSILIPARNEMFLARTVQELLKHKRGNTEIIVGLDGAWSDPAVDDHPDVTIFYSPTSLGQRGMTNQLCRLSNAKYVMKIDAHVAVDEGFDVKMMSAMQDNYTMVPLMRNLYAFDWVCRACGDKRYQGRRPTECNNKKCENKEDFFRDIKWIGKDSPKSTAFRFDKTLHFQYWNEFKKRPEGKGDLTDTLTIQGSCFMLTRDKYWELNICDEEFGSWGQQGVEVALKTWLSGGRVVCNQTTWYAHMFRTQGGDFGFPYPQNQKQIDHAREYSRDLFINDKWPQAIRTFQSVLDQFAPVPEWHVPTGKKLTKGVVYYTDGELDERLAVACRQQLMRGIKGKHIVGVTLNPQHFKGLELAGFKETIVMEEERGYLTMAKQILAGLRALDTDIVYFAEHDVMYHPSHFEFVPPQVNKYYYNTNVWRVRQSDSHALFCENLQQLSGLVAFRETLIQHFEERVRRLQDLYGKTNDEHERNSYVRAMGFEPGTHGRPKRIDDLKAESFKSRLPNLDIRHDKNLTPSRWNKEQFRNERYTQGWTEKMVHDIEGWQEVALK